MYKAKITLNLLMDDDAAYFVNIKNTCNWKTEIARNTQIIVVTTQIFELEAKASKLLTNRTSTGQSATPSCGTEAGPIDFDKYIFEL